MTIWLPIGLRYYRYRTLTHARYLLDGPGIIMQSKCRCFHLFLDLVTNFPLMCLQREAMVCTPLPCIGPMLTRFLRVYIDMNVLPPRASLTHPSGPPPQKPSRPVAMYGRPWPTAVHLTGLTAQPLGAGSVAPEQSPAARHTVAKQSSHRWPDVCSVYVPTKASAD